MTTNCNPLLPIREVLRRLNISRSTLYRWIKLERFPRPLELGPQVVRWRESEVTAWIDSKEVTGGGCAQGSPPGAALVAERQPIPAQ